MIVTRILDSVDRVQRRVFVPTMGALHEGHRELIRMARRNAGSDGEVVVSVFVNPTQFAAGEDYDSYPRTMEADEALCRQEGVDILYAPSVDDIYGSSTRRSAVTIDPGPLGDELEGASRPGHFSGVLTVVAVLFAKVRPDASVFGEKDFQQLELIRRMNDDLGFGIDVIGVDTVRDADGLALSSRNSYLTDEQREDARAIPQALAAGQAAALAGPDAVVTAAQRVLDDAGITIDYLDVRGTDCEPLTSPGAARLFVACLVGTTRLIDNCAVELGSV